MKLRSLVLASSVLLGALGCSASDSGDGDKDGDTDSKPSAEVLQLFSWWTAPGEAEALRALKDTYTSEFKGARVAQQANPTAGTWQEVLADKIEDSPWDVVQLSASDLTNFRADHPGALAEVDDIYADAGLDDPDKDVMMKEIREAVTRDGHPYGVVTGVHRNNAFLYNKQLFDENGLEPPNSIEELLEVSAKLKEAGVTPIATDMDTWVLRILFDEILAGTMGAENFAAFVGGELEPADAEDDLTSAIDTFDTILTEYVDTERGSASDYEWSTAAEDLQKGDAAMLFHGDWAKGYLVFLGWTPGVDFGVLGPPGASDLFVYGADMFCLPSTAPHPELAKQFLSVVASPEGQVAFNSYKGATPMRDDVEDKDGELSLDGLVNAKVLIPGHANATWDDGIAAFALDHDKAALLDVYMTAKP